MLTQQPTAFVTCLHRKRALVWCCCACFGLTLWFWGPSCTGMRPCSVMINGHTLFTTSSFPCQCWRQSSCAQCRHTGRVATSSARLLLVLLTVLEAVLEQVLGLEQALELELVQVPMQRQHQRRHLSQAPHL